MDKETKIALHYIQEALKKGYEAESILIKDLHYDYLQSLNERYCFYRCELKQILKAINEK
jgi:hypothetical protein